MNRQLTIVATVLALAPACTRDEGTHSRWRQDLDSLVAAERAFARLAVDSTVQAAFLANVDDTTMLFQPGPVPAASWLLENPFPVSLALEWAPAWADISADGSLGYTTGPWRAGRRGSGTYPDHGDYMTLWRKTPAGFIAVLDKGVSHDPPADTTELGLASPPSTPRASSAGDDAQSVGIADEDLNAALAGGANAWSDYVAENVRWLRNGSLPAFGPAAIPRFDDGIRFVALGASMAPSRDFGYSWGEIHAPASTDAEPSGYYVRVWRTDAAGSWKVIVDNASGF
jgi:ketosteroid isomerase-like protein